MPGPYSGNLQGGYRFFTLTTGRVVTRNKFTELPAPDTVLARVNTLGAGQPALLTFTDRRNRPIGDVELPGVYGADDAHEFRYELDNNVDADIPELVDRQPELHDDDEAEDEAPPELARTDMIKSERVEEPTEMEPAGVPETTGVENVEGTEIAGVRRSNRVRFVPSNYTPSLKGKVYAMSQQCQDWSALTPNLKGKAYGMTQQEVLLHPDIHT